MVQLTRSVQVVNASGLHARPSHAVVTTALEFESELTIRYGGQQVNGKSILQLMTLNAAQGAELELTGIGEDAGPMLTALALLFESGFAEST